jgi:hypothetical protein
VLFARGDWDDLSALGRDLIELVRANPTAQLCLAAAGAAGYAVVADALRGRATPMRIDEFVARAVPESAAVRDADLVLPLAVLGRDCAALSTTAFGRSGAVWDREVIDPLGLRLVMALVVQARWNELTSPLDRLDQAAGRGSRLAKAVATAARGEMAGDRSRTSHRELRELGYIGLSQTLAFRSADAAVR